MPHTMVIHHVLIRALAFGAGQMTEDCGSIGTSVLEFWGYVHNWLLA
jgi:hypothetical protein